ncbi:MAG: DUF1611 domain-containing protein, partial [Armatimonadetes bacterium]|nr:DUF1611 domain-containing protein [Armatimonadota bacterium]
HGKTTTASLLAWVLVQAGQDPSFMVGGIPRNLGVNTRLGSGDLFLLEGDEYLSAKFDRTPKFLYYRPHVGVIMNVALDHINFFRDQEEYIAAFEQFAGIVPEEGLLLGSADSPNVPRVFAAARCPVKSFGYAEGADWQAANLRLEPECSRFDVVRAGKPWRRDVAIGQPGRYVVYSALAALAIAERLGLDTAAVREALLSFRGARRRMELRGEAGGVTVVEDFAHHPTQARTSLETAAVRYPGRRLWCVYDLHTFSSRNRRYLPEYAQAFGPAHGVILPAMHHPEQIPEDERMSVPELTEAVRQTQPNVRYMEDRPAIVDFLVNQLQPDDVALFMSSGGLEDLIKGTLARLQRLLIYTPGEFFRGHSKTADGVVRYGRNTIVGIVDASRTGACADVMGIRPDIPFFPDVASALPARPDALLIGVAPRGGRLPAEWRAAIRFALEHGMDIISGLHQPLATDAEFQPLAARLGRRILDVREPPTDLPVGNAKVMGIPQQVVLTVGSDCAIGKMTAALEIEKSARARGRTPVFIPTGQTGIMIAGYGISIDRVIGDFMAGATEKLILDHAPGHDLVLVEGQGSLLHPGYSGVTLGLLHGSMPTEMILCHQPTRQLIRDSTLPIPPLPEVIQLYEAMTLPLRKAKVIGVALNCYDLTDEEARREIARTEDLTGLPTTDTVKFGAECLAEAIDRARE